MSNSLTKVTSNWSHVGGCTFLQCVQECVADPDVFVRPQLNKLVDDEKSILLSKMYSSEHCELNIKLSTNYKIQSMSFVCNIIKVEIFQGPIKEYLQTNYGVVMDEDDLFKTYRYDVEIEKSGITDITLKFLTDSNDVCIFGIIIYTAPNPNGITTLLPNTVSVNVDSLENILKNSTIQGQPIFNKFKNIFQLTKSNRNNSSTLDQYMEQQLSEQRGECSTTLKKTNEEIFDILKLHIDQRFQEMENRLNKYLADMEERQNERLNMILNVLTKINK